jgi:hypothetical protein
MVLLSGRIISVSEFLSLIPTTTSTVSSSRPTGSCPESVKLLHRTSDNPIPPLSLLQQAVLWISKTPNQGRTFPLERLSEAEDPELKKLLARN